MAFNFNPRKIMGQIKNPINTGDLLGGGGNANLNPFNNWEGRIKGFGKHLEGKFKPIENAGKKLTPAVYKPGSYSINETPFQTAESGYGGLKGGFDDTRDAWIRYGLNAQGRTAPGMDTVPQGEFRAKQMELAGQLAQQAAGQGPSLASLQMQQNTDNAIKSAMALAASGRSGSAGGRLKMAQDQAAAYQQQGARDSAALRIQEQLAAREQLAGTLGQGRQQDLSLASADLEAQLKQTGLNDAYTMGLGDLGLGYDKLGLDSYQAGSNNAMDLEKLKLQQFLEMERLRQAGIASQNQGMGGMLTGLGGLAVAAGTAYGQSSDRNSKKNIKDGDKSAKSFLTAVAKNMGIEKPNYEEMPSAERMKKFMSRLKTYEYDYKEPGKWGEGKHISPMAQDLENDPMTASMVTDTKEGKIVNYNQPGMLMAGLATLSRENDEIRKMVAGLAKKRRA